MQAKVHIIIPARFESTRFPGKLLQDLKGKTVLERVYQQAQLANPQSITIATDNERIADHVRNFGAEVVMTSTAHESGTDRIAEVVAKGSYAAQDIIINVQGDEPFIAPQLIKQVVESLIHSRASVSTLCWPIAHIDMLHNPNLVKVVCTKEGYALYFSRSPIPAHRDNPQSIEHCFGHIGLYAYRADFLLDYVSWPVCELERFEALEQLRVLWSGHAIKVDVACVEPLQDINTIEDLVYAQSLITSS